MTRKKESSLQREVRRALENEIGGVWTKIHGNEFQEPGIGDLLGCVCGLHIEVEVKRGKGQLSDTQLLRRWRIKNMGGGAYFTARSPEVAVYKVARYLREHGKTPANRAAGLSSKRILLPLKRKDRRIVHATAHRQNTYHVPRTGKTVVKRIS